MSGLVPVGSRPPATLDDVLAWCEQGKQALVEAETVAQAHDLLGVASTLEHAVRARDLGTEAAVAASALKIRAERRLGQLLREQPKAPPGPRPGDPSASLRDLPPSLSEQGISYNESSTYQRLAAVPDPVFEQAVEAEQGEALAKKRGPNVTRAGVMRRANPGAPQNPDEAWLAANRFVTACQKVRAARAAFIDAVRFGHYPGDLPLVGEGIDELLTETQQAAATALHEWNRKAMRTDLEGNRRRTGPDIIRQLVKNHDGRLSFADALAEFGEEASHAEWEMAAAAALGSQIRGWLRSVGLRKINSTEQYVGQEQLTLAEWRELAAIQAERGTQYFDVVRRMAVTCEETLGTTFDAEAILEAALDKRRSA